MPTMLLFKSLLYLLVLVIHSLAAPGDKSKAKCLEYAKAVYADEVSPVLSAKTSSDKVSQCGILEIPLIIGGVKATPKEFPHMAVIGYGKTADQELKWHCGGALISENFILTAAHCAESRDQGSAQKVRLGEIDFELNDETEIQERKVAYVRMHPDYKPPAKYDDIALMKLDEPVSFTGFVRPACLHFEEKIAEPKAIATGFGKLAYDADDGSKQLMKVTINIIEKDQCTKAYGQEIKTAAMKEGIKDSLICAGELGGGKDTCQGDSGGPLQVVLKEPECMYSLIGVTSFGKFCGFKNSPAMYSRISFYIDWIEGIVWR